MKQRKKLNKKQKIGPNSQRETFAKLDGRGAIARRYKSLRGKLFNQLGGEDKCTPGQGILIESIAMRMIRLEMLFAQAAEGELSVEADRRINWYSSSNSRDLAKLGLLDSTGEAGDEEVEATIFDFVGMLNAGEPLPGEEDEMEAAG